MSFTIAIVDDSTGFTESLADTLEKHLDCKVVFHTADGTTLIEELAEMVQPPDICLLDPNTTPGGFNIVEKIKTSLPSVKCVVYTFFLLEYNLLLSYQYGAAAALPKESGLEELLKALEEVARNGQYISGELPTRIAESIRNGTIQLPDLTDHEREFIYLCCRGLSNREIARSMQTDLKEVDKHAENICSKLSVNSREGIVLYALRSGMVA